MNEVDLIDSSTWISKTFENPLPKYFQATEQPRGKINACIITSLKNMKQKIRMNGRFIHLKNQINVEAWNLFLCWAIPAFV